MRGVPGAQMPRSGRFKRLELKQLIRNNFVAGATAGGAELGRLLDLVRAAAAPPPAGACPPRRARSRAGRAGVRGAARAGGAAAAGALQQPRDHAGLPRGVHDRARGPRRQRAPPGAWPARRCAPVARALTGRGRAGVPLRVPVPHREREVRRGPPFSLAARRAPQPPEVQALSAARPLPRAAGRRSCSWSAGAWSSRTRTAPRWSTWRAARRVRGRRPPARAPRGARRGPDRAPGAAGVVGCTPTLRHNDCFQYHSRVTLPGAPPGPPGVRPQRGPRACADARPAGAGPAGSLRGAYQMTTKPQAPGVPVRGFDAAIAPCRFLAEHPVRTLPWPG